MTCPQNAQTRYPSHGCPSTERQAQGQAYKLADGGGMYLEVMPTGAKPWRMKYRQVGGKENRLTFGPYPETTLAEARDKFIEQIYNAKQMHSALGYVSPNPIEAQLAQQAA